MLDTKLDIRPSFGEPTESRINSLILNLITGRILDILTIHHWKLMVVWISSWIQITGRIPGQVVGQIPDINEGRISGPKKHVQILLQQFAWLEVVPFPGKKRIMKF